MTGYLDSAARNLGLDQQLAHDDRYDLADEYLDVVYKLWEHSWDADAVVRDKTTGVYADPAKVHEIGHDGLHYQVPGIHLCEPSPQRTPVLYQAGASSRGLVFAGRHAECVFISAPTEATLARAVAGIRDAVKASGRDPADVLIYAQALIVTGATRAEAQAKYDDYRQHVDIEAALALLSGWTGIDFAGYDPDAVIEYLENDAGRTALASFSRADPSRKWTVREAAQFVGLGGRGPVLIGAPAEIADHLQRWQATTGVDGFNLTYAVARDLPGRRGSRHPRTAGARCLSNRVRRRHAAAQALRQGTSPRAAARGSMSDHRFGAARMRIACNLHASHATRSPQHAHHH